MERLYNPALMSDEEMRATFVARQPLIDELLSLIEHQPDGAGIQHVALIGSRGMGKTTVLLRLRLALAERGLDAHWQAVCFPEESYSVADLAGFWVEALRQLAAETHDPALDERATRLMAEYPKADDLHAAAFAVLKDWRRQHRKRLVLLVDNLDLILEQINDDRDNARLRDVLMNDGTLMLIGGATTFFHEARAYDQPLYNFFKIYNLEELEFSEIQDLLRQRARRDQIPDFERKLTEHPGRLRALIYFTGGNPRLVLMLYQVLMQADFVQVRAGLEKLIEEVTPYYKAKTESLAVQQRQVLDAIARATAITHEGVTPTTIAAATRLPANQVSTQLKRLVDLGYLRAANLRERSSYYVLSERLYAIWYQMRFGRDARQRMHWLVSFLQVWYEDADILTTGKQLETRFHEHIASGRLSEARGVLEHRRYLADAAKDGSLRASEMDRVVQDYLDLKDLETLKNEVLPDLRLEQLSPETLLALKESDCTSEQAMEQALAAITESPTNSPEARALATNLLGFMAGTAGRTEEALRHFDRAVAINPEADFAWCNRGRALINLKKYEEALASYDRAVAINPEYDAAWYNQGLCLGVLKRFEEAVASFDVAIAFKPDNNDAWCCRGLALADLGRYEEALASYDQAVAIKPEDDTAWSDRGICLGELERFEEAIGSFDRAIALKPDNGEAWYYRGVSYSNKSVACLQEGNRELATLNWREAWKSAEHVEKEKWHELTSETLLTFAQLGHPELARQLLTEAGLDEPLFPLARARDYLLTGEAALLEKLSPEVKKLVEEIVEKLRASGQPAKRTSPQQRAKTARSGPRRRMAKQLR